MRPATLFHEDTRFMRVPFTAVRSDGDVLHSLRSMLVPWGLAIALITAVPLGAIAAPITWGSATTISGDGDVSTTGTLLYAYNFGPSSVAGPVTVGGVSISESPGPTIRAAPVRCGTTPWQPRPTP